MLVSQVEFHTVIVAGYGYELLANVEARRRTARDAAACGIRCDPGQVAVKVTPIPAQSESWWYQRFPDSHVWAHVELAADHLYYPLCGDWWCDDGVDWEWADPLADLAVYAGVAIEHGIVERGRADGMPQWTADALDARRRVQARGLPLWTVDLRPRSLRGAA